MRKCRNFTSADVTILAGMIRVLDPDLLNTWLSCERQTALDGPSHVFVLLPKGAHVVLRWDTENSNTPLGCGAA